MTVNRGTGNIRVYSVSQSLLSLLPQLIRLDGFKVNHKPKLASTSTKTTITPSSTDNSYNLTITDDANVQATYGYTGSQQPSEACALIFDPETQSFILDRIDTQFTFNLRSTPNNKSAKALASQHPQLETTAPDPESGEDDLFDEEGQITGDTNNPYDYRHFLKRRRTSSPEPIEAPSIAPPVRRPSRAKPKQRPRPQPKRASTPPREEADADNEDSDDGGLTIEMDPVTKPRPNRFNGAFAGLAGDGPISLRSAASSVSPAMRPESNSEESDEDVSDDMKLPSPLGRAPTPGDDDGEEEEEDQSPPPQQQPQPQPGQQEDEDDDAADLEAELEQALESQADGDEEGGGVEITQRYVQESSSESEEE